ncbi:MAG TPA: site-specific DNA-methyltransferase [Salinivirgaceae bacterium]|jgi:adenine-specific DNA-methyltransferase|nr:site-specific DNA-methyltransferase [Bacteroidota bacterium]HPW67254.1 site-specific DNA-methyltransferase [Salinivirgaceae bacterium]
MSNEQKITTEIKVPNKDLETLKIHFPHCFDKDGNFQFEKFKNNLTEKEINFSTESYGLDWLGKSYARLLASDPATTLLKADETHNAKPENNNSENLLIKGDNLEVLKHLANAYYEQVKMIYIDPPYNTGSDGFTYQDDRKFTVKELQQLIGVDAEKAKRILDFTQSKSNSHSAWLTFMYPRLYIAKQLLKDEGVIYVSIDDSEVSQLKMLLDEIFGEENFRGIIIRATGTTTGQEALKIGSSYDSCLCYSKTAKFQLKGIPLKGKDLNRFNNDDNDGKGKYALLQLRKTGNADRKEDREGMFFPITAPDGSQVFPIGPTDYLSRWRTGKDKFQKFLDEGLIVWKENGEDIEEFDDDEDENEEDEITDYSSVTNENVDISKFKSKWKPYVKYYLSERTKQVSNLWTDIDGNKKGSIELKLLFEKKKLFENPKPTDFLKRLITISCSSDELILDFFAGSGTTADAVLNMNSDDLTNRKFILVQIPELIDPKKSKTTYTYVKNDLGIEVPTIFDVTKERVIRAARKIKTEKTEYDGDLGFKIFETTPIWEDYNFEAEQFDSSQTLFDVGKLTEDDIKALLTTWKTYDGIALTQDLESIDLSGYTAYYGNGRLYLMHKGFTTDSLKTLLEKIDTDKHFEPKSIIAFGYHLESKSLREISENVKTYNNKKKSDIDFITRY